MSGRQKLLLGVVAVAIVAVTGAYSFIGAEVIRALEQDPRYRKVLAIDIRKPTQPLAKTTFRSVVSVSAL